MKQRPQTTFAGFAPSNTTPVPDEFFDVLAPQLGEAELRVLIYIFRRTFGFKKYQDAISLRQMVEGIRRRDGRQLDHGAGVVKSAAARAVKRLVEKGIISVRRNRSVERGDEPTTYTLRFRDAPVSSAETRGSAPRGQGDVLDEDTQETGRQDTAQQETAPSKSITSNGTEETDRSQPPRSERIELLMDEISVELGDDKHARSNRTQALRLLARSGRTESPFESTLYEARSIVRDEVNRRRHSGEGIPIRNRAAFFFATLRDLLKLNAAKPTASISDGHSGTVSEALNGP